MNSENLKASLLREINPRVIGLHKPMLTNNYLYMMYLNKVCEKTIETT